MNTSTPSPATACPAAAHWTLAAILLAQATAAAAVLPPMPGGGVPKLVPLSDPYQLPYVGGECDESMTRQVVGWEVNEAQRVVAELSRPRSTYYRAGRDLHPFDSSWSDWIEGAKVALYWVIDSTGSFGHGTARLDGGLQGRERLRIVIPPMPGMAGEVIVDNHLEVDTARIEAANLDWPELDAKTLSADARIWLRDIEGDLHSSTGGYSMSVPDQVSLSESSGATFQVDPTGAPTSSISYSPQTLASATHGEGFVLDLWTPIVHDPVTSRVQIPAGRGFDRWYRIECLAQAHLRVQERDFFYDGSRLQMGIVLANRFERVQITCWPEGRGVASPPAAAATPPVAEGDDAEQIGVASEQPEIGPRLELRMSSDLNVGELVSGLIRLVGGDQWCAELQICAEPPGVVELNQDTVVPADGVPSLVTLRTLSEGDFVLRFVDVAGRVPTLEHHGVVGPPDTSRIGLSFVSARKWIGDLVSLGVYLPAPANERLRIDVTSSNPLVASVDGSAAASRWIECGERQALFALHVCGEGDTNLEAVASTRGAVATAHLHGTDLATTGIRPDVHDGEVVSANRTLSFELVRPAPSGFVMTWRLIGDRQATLGGQSFGTYRAENAMQAGDRFELPLDIGGGKGIELELTCYGSLEGECAVFLYGSPQGTAHLLDDLVRDLSLFEGGPGALTQKARLARRSLATGRADRAGGLLARLLKAIDHPAWAGAVFPDTDRSAIRARIESTAQQIGLELDQ